jgi:hypothetical protein
MSKCNTNSYCKMQLTFLPKIVKNDAMGEKPEPARPALEFSYGVVEAALGGLYGINSDDQRRSDFRARINLFQRANVLGVRVGKGQRLSYSVPQIERWFCCLELAELGISPTTAARLVIDEWAQFAPIFRAAQRTVIYDPSDSDVVLLLPGVHVMSGSWAPGGGFPGVPIIRHCTVRDLPKRIAQYMQLGHDDPAGLVPRILAVNLSTRLRSLHAALAPAYMNELRAERQIEKTKGRKRK